MKKILIANRGEIAVRIIRACRDMGITTVAIYADSDANALHTRMADEAFALSGDRPEETYLNIKKIIALASASGAEGIHPGYGFLSERPEFAQAVLDSGLCWIGPSPESITLLGDKIQARKIAQKVGAPLASGTSGPVKGVNEVIAFARKHGLPVAIKAAHGGGGRGLRVAWTMEELDEQYHSAVREAIAAFGKGECYVEQFLDKPRHVEVQILADLYGNVRVLGTRDCTLQRRNQKLIEEAPAPFLTAEQQTQMYHAAVAICKKAGYSGAGTVEFLLSQDGLISFLEVNTRLQVEHTVTEEITGIDLVAAQINIARGERLPTTTPPSIHGHAFEFRINAEDPAQGFLPVCGCLKRFSPPSGPGVRLDSGVETGSLISPFYDSLMAKLIVRGANRKQALKRAIRALEEFHIAGVASVLPFHRAAIVHSDFAGAKHSFRVHTRWIENDFSASFLPSARNFPVETAELIRSFIEIGDKQYRIGLPAKLLSGINISQHEYHINKSTLTNVPDGQLLAPVTGVLQRWIVGDDDSVQEGDTLAILESMKMETPLLAPHSGIVHIKVATGEQIQAGEVIGLISQK
ncbi:ATP-grasp domain-containing protein [Serratia marcescens]|nr:ATP-grasp domain-containing protein [Serratia marcescens]MBH2865965.1 ATP-grasp domain-containing protein [Serratia marcescens]